MAAAQLPERPDVGTHHPATSEQRLGHRQTKTLGQRWREQSLAIAITPLQLRFGDSVQKHHMSADSSFLNEPVDVGGLGSGNSNNDQPGFRMDSLLAQQPNQNPERKKDILVAPVLCNAKKKRNA
jgi:hypothetical protein